MHRNFLIIGIIIALFTGALLGGFFPSAAVHFSLLGDILLNLLMMAVVPLVICSIITGIPAWGHCADWALWDGGPWCITSQPRPFRSSSASCLSTSSVPARASPRGKNTPSWNTPSLPATRIRSASIPTCSKRKITTKVTVSFSGTRNCGDTSNSSGEEFPGYLFNPVLCFQHCAATAHCRCGLQQGCVSAPRFRLTETRGETSNHGQNSFHTHNSPE